MSALIGSVRIADGSGNDPLEEEKLSGEEKSEDNGDKEVPPSRKAAVSAPSEMENKKVWTPEQARYMHVCQGHPSDEILTWLFENGIVLGCALSGRDIRNAHQMLEPCLTCLVGKARQRLDG